MKSLILCFLVLINTAHAQNQLLLLGNNAPICLSDSDSMIVQRADSLPDRLSDYDAILIFSNARSGLSEREIEQLLHYTANGGGLYCGADNLPLQQEFNQLTGRIFAREAWGNFSSHQAQVGDQSFLRAITADSLYAGETTVAVPLDSRMRVEAWIDDQPLIASYHFGKGMMIFDGGYSRFYCSSGEENQSILRLIIRFICSNHTD